MERRSIIIPHIWVPRVKTGELLVEAGPVLRGEFMLELRDKESGKVRKRIAFHNLVLNTMFDALLTGSTLKWLCGYISLGTGVTPPQPTDTALQSQIIRKSGTVTTEWGTGHCSVTTETFFNTTEANGDLSEVGMGNSSSLYVRELIRDANGNPVVITKTDQDTLTVKHTLRMEAPALGYSECVFGEYICKTYYVNGVFFNWLGIAVYDQRISIGSVYTWCKLGNSNAPSVPTDAGDAIRGTSSATITGASWGGYTNGQFYRDRTLQVPANVANFVEGIGEAIWSSPVGSAGYTTAIYGRTTFDPQIPKTSAYTLEIQHRLSFARAA